MEKILTEGRPFIVSQQSTWPRAAEDSVLCGKLNSSHGLQVKTGDSIETKYVDEFLLSL